MTTDHNHTDRLTDTPPGDPTTLTDLCASCSSPVKTFANLQVVRDEKHLAPTWMPPGGCTCMSMQIDPTCARCFPSDLICQPCGDRSVR